MSIFVNADIEANLTLDGINIELKAPIYYTTPIGIGKNSNVFITLKNSNSLINRGNNRSVYYPAIWVGENANLTFTAESTGSLYGYTINGPAVIGSRSYRNDAQNSTKCFKSITINGGSFNLHSGSNDLGGGACIGTGYDTNLQGDASITINGGYINATATNSAAIGAGVGDNLDTRSQSKCPNIYINGGTVIANGGNMSKVLGISIYCDGIGFSQRSASPNKVTTFVTGGNIISNGQNIASYTCNPARQTLEEAVINVGRENAGKTISEIGIYTENGSKLDYNIKDMVVGPNGEVGVMMRDIDFISKMVVSDGDGETHVFSGRKYTEDNENAVEFREAGVLHSLTVGNAEGVDINFTSEEVSEGELVIFSVVPKTTATGVYKLKGMSINRSDSNPTTPSEIDAAISNLSIDRYSFIMPDYDVRIDASAELIEGYGDLVITSNTGVAPSYDTVNKVLNLSGSGDVTVELLPGKTESADRIEFADGASVNLTIKDVVIRRRANGGGSALRMSDLAGDCSIIMEGNNEFHSGDAACIYKGAGEGKLTFKGSGALLVDASARRYSTAIGSDIEYAGKNKGDASQDSRGIVIESGNITIQVGANAHTTLGSQFGNTGFEMRGGRVNVLGATDSIIGYYLYYQGEFWEVDTEIKISGGTLVTPAIKPYDSYSDGISARNKNYKTIITGGSVKNDTGSNDSRSGNVVNDAGESLAYVVIALKNGENPQSKVRVESIDLTKDGQPYSYGMNDVYTDMDGKLYLHLPNGVHVGNVVTADGKIYKLDLSIHYKEEYAGRYLTEEPEAGANIYSYLSNDNTVIAATKIKDATIEGITVTNGVYNESAIIVSDSGKVVMCDGEEVEGAIAKGPVYYRVDGETKTLLESAPEKTEVGEYELVYEVDKDGYAGTLRIPASIEKKALTEEMIAVKSGAYYSDDSEKYFDVKIGGTELTEETDYTFTQEKTKEGEDSFTVNIKVTGKGNYSSQIEKEIEVALYEDNAEAFFSEGDIVNGWNTTGEATLNAPDGYSLKLKAENGVFEASKTIGESDIESGKVYYYLKSEETGYVLEQKAAAIQMDVHAPVYAETPYAVSDVTSSSFKVTFSATDEESATVTYYAGIQGTEPSSNTTGVFEFSGLNANTEYKVSYYAVDGHGKETQPHYVSEAIKTNKGDFSKVILSIPEGTEYVYTGNSQVPQVTVKDGEVTVPESEYEVIFTDGNNGHNTTNAGTIKVTVAPKADGNYEGNTASFATYVIKKAVPTVGNVREEKTSAGGKEMLTTPLNEIKLLAVTSVSGTLSVTDSTLKIGNHEYSWKFVPTDSDNYEEVVSTDENKVGILVYAEKPSQVPTLLEVVLRGEKTLADAILPSGWEWVPVDDNKLPNTVGSTADFIARYVGDDKDYYQEREFSVRILMKQYVEPYVAPANDDEPVKPATQNAESAQTTAPAAVIMAKTGALTTPVTVSNVAGKDASAIENKNESKETSLEVEETKEEKEELENVEEESKESEVVLKETITATTEEEIKDANEAKGWGVLLVVGGGIALVAAGVYFGFARKK